MSDDVRAVVVRGLAAEDEVKRLRQGLWDTWAALGHDTDGDTGPGALISGMGVDGFIRMVIEDAKTVMAENDADWTHELDRADAAEAKVARVEALADGWEGVAGYLLRRDSEAQGRYLMQRVEEIRTALDGAE